VPPKTTPPIEHGFDAFGAHVRSTLEEIGRTFSNPDDDWFIGLLHIETAQGGAEVYMLDGTCFDPRFKDATFKRLYALLRERSTLRYALMANAWVIKGKVHDDETQERARERANAIVSEWRGHFDEHPERIEALTLEIVERDRAECWGAEIVRSPDRPPTLKPWVRYADVDGRIPGLRKALS